MIGARPKCPMSAYSASAPVNARTTAASAKNAVEKWLEEEVERVPWRERLEDLRVRGDAVDAERATTRNQTNMIGPNRRPTVAVPSRCSMNSTTRIAEAIGTTRCSSDGAATSTPSTADSTEIAGVIMPSPRNSDGAEDPERREQHLRASRARDVRRAADRVMRAMMPPSPSLSARITSST